MSCRLFVERLDMGLSVLAEEQMFVEQHTWKACGQVFVVHRAG